MPRYLALFKYSEAGAKGLMKEKAAAREAAGKRAYESVGGTSEALYWIPNGEYHGVEIIALQAPRQPGGACLFHWSFLGIPHDRIADDERIRCSLGETLRVSSTWRLISSQGPNLNQSPQSNGADPRHR